MGIALWGGPECTLNRVGNGYFDQVERTGHGARVEDLDRFAALGFTALRYPVLWERVAPDSALPPDWRWTDERLPRIRDLGMTPIAGLLHHGSGPRDTSLLDPAFPQRFAQYAGMVARRYPWLRDYTPINEPLTTARFSGLYGVWFPHHTTSAAFVRALLHQVTGVALAMRAIREVAPDARLIQTEDCGRCFGTGPTGPQVAFENHRRWLTWDLLVGRVDAGHPLHAFLLDHGATRAELDFLVEHPTPPQVLGLNYYLTSDRFLDHRLDAYPEAVHGGNGVQRYADVDAVRGRWSGIEGHLGHLLSAWRRYGIPVALTEVHLACTREEQLRWLSEAWLAAQNAQGQGAVVEAVTPWALLGSYDWDSLVTIAQGHYEAGTFDVRGSTPRPTGLATMIRQLASGERPTDAALDDPGWWRRPERLLHPPASTATAVRRGGSRPLLILGASGTLGQAIRRVAQERGLPVVSAGRREFDIGSHASIRDLLLSVTPWAVVNATGYVRVDDAERDSDSCFNVNTAGAVNVASVCAELQVPLVTFSSDLVFDGARTEPYTEGDTTHPLNVYGASKAEAERRIEAIMPAALIVRTSAFFGPWDSSNFVVRALAAVGRGEQWPAASDVVVSPTYVPDLANAALDLLHDRECGIWHLSNEGPMSWFELGQAAAFACGGRADLIVPATGDELAGSALRPVYSALASVRGRVMRSTDEALRAFAGTLAASSAARLPEAAARAR